MSHPFFGSGGGDGSHPFFDDEVSTEPDPRLKTARGRQSVEAENKAENVTKLQELLKRPNLDPTQRRRIEAQIERMSGAWTREKTEDRRIVKGAAGDLIDALPEGPGGGPMSWLKGLNQGGSNIPRGLAAGVPKASAGIADMGGALGNVLLPGQPLNFVRDFAQESMAGADEILDPQGAGGLIGDIGGQLAGGSVPYAGITLATGKALLKILPQGSRAAQLIRAAHTGNAMQRIGGETLMSIPIDAFQAATLEDATLEDKLKQFGISVGANAIGAGVMPASKLPKAPGDVTLDVEKVKQIPGTRSAETANKVKGLTAAGDAKVAEREAVKKQKAADKAAAIELFRKENPDLKWNDLSKDDKLGRIAAVEAARVAEADAAAKSGTAQVVNVEDLGIIEPGDGPDVGPPPPAGGAPADVPDANLNKPSFRKTTVEGGNDRFEFDLPNGDVAFVQGALDGDTFRIGFVGSTGGNNSMGAAQTRQIYKQLLEATGAKRVAGSRRSGALPTGRDVTTPAEGSPAQAPNLPASEGFIQPPEAPAAPAGNVPRPTFRRRVANAIDPTIVEEQRNLNRAADTDELTQVANRRALNKALPTAEADANTSVVVFDANNFGQINKVLGQEAGDSMIQSVADAVRRAAAEFGVGARVFRRGGDEFVVLAPKDVADKVRARAEELFGSQKAGPVEVSLSGTVGNTFDEADKILKAAKDARKAAGKVPEDARVYTIDKPFGNPTDEEFDAAINQAIGGVAPRDQEIPPGSVFKFTDRAFMATGLDLMEVDPITLKPLPDEPNSQAKGFDRIRDEPLYENPGDVAEVAQQIEGHDLILFDRIYDRLIREFEAGTIAPEDTRMLKNLQAIDQHIANRPKSAGPSPQVGPQTAVSLEELTWALTGAPGPRPGRPKLKDTPYKASDLKKLSKDEAAQRGEGGWDVPVYELELEGQKVLFARFAATSNSTLEWHYKTPGAGWLPTGGNVDLAVRSAAHELSRTSGTGQATPNPTQLPPNQPTQPTPTTKPTRQFEPHERLETAEHDKPLSEMSLSDLDDMLDVVDARLEAGDESPAIIRDLEKIRNAKLAQKGAAKVTAQSNPKTPPVKPVVGESPRVRPEPSPISNDEATLKKLRNKNPRKMTLEELELHKPDHEERMLLADDRDREIYQDRLDKINEEIAARKNPPRSDGVVAHMPAELGGAFLGFMGGIALGDTDEERARYAIYGAFAGVGAGAAAKRIKINRQQTNPNISLEQLRVRESVITQQQIDDAAKQRGFLNKAEEWYLKIARPSYASEKATVRAGGKMLAANENPGKRLAMFGAWVSQAESFMFGRPSLEGPDGNRIKLQGVLNAQEIAHMAQGDTQSLGDLMAALTVLEHYSLTGRNRSGMDLAAAVKFAENAPDHLHAAATEARKLHLGMLDVMMTAGIISPETRVKLAQEEFYAPLERVFGMEIKERPKPIGTGKVNKNISAPNPLKQRGKASVKPIRNPFETMVANIPKVMRAAEMNKAKISLVNLRNANPDALKHLIDLAPGMKNVSEAVYKSQIDALKGELDISNDEAIGLVNAFSPDALTAQANSMSVWRNGALETYRLDEYLALGYKSVSPPELDILVKMLGAVSNTARGGIVNNPIFIGWQAFRDNWQMTMNSQHGFRWGIDWVQGWQHAMRNSREHQNYIAGGGGHSSFAQRSALDVHKSLTGIKTHGSNAVSTAFNQVKQGDFADAYHSLVAPIMEAGRVGEYLRARGRGKSVIDAVYAAKEVGGNFQSVGPAIRALAHMTMFLNPAIKAMDQTLYRSGAHPFRSPEEGRKWAAAKYLSKAFFTIAVPSYLFYLASEGDQEIEQVRRTESGRRFWWFRDHKGRMQKLPKPIFEGQVFGTSVETTMDAWKESNPEEYKNWAVSVINDAALNLLPTAMVVPLSVMANHDFNFGSQVVPEYMAGLDPALQQKHNGSIVARVVGESLSPISERITSESIARFFSPAAIDYMLRNFGGTLTAEAAYGATLAAAYQQENFLPPANEWPIIRQTLVNYPNTSTQAVEEFYSTAAVLERRLNTFNELRTSDVDQMMVYFKRYEKEIMMAKMYGNSRKKIADLRQGIETIREMPPEAITPQERRNIQREMTLQIIELAKNNNLVARSVMKTIDQASSPQ